MACFRPSRQNQNFATFSTGGGRRCTTAPRVACPPETPCPTDPVSTLASGSVDIAASSTATLGPFSRAGSTRLWPAVYVTSIPGTVSTSYVDATLAALTAEGLAFTLDFVGANQVQLVLRNTFAATAITVEWAIFAITP